MIDDLIGAKRVKFNIIDLGGPFKVKEGGMFVLVLDPAPLEECMFEVPVLALDDEDFAVNSHGLFPGLHIPAYFLMF